MIVTPQTGSATEQASQAAREAIEKGGSALAVRASDGTYAPPLPDGVPSAAAAAAAAAAEGKPTTPSNIKPEAGQAPAGEEKPEGEGEGTPPIDEAVAARTVTLTLADGELDLELPDEAAATVIRNALDAVADVQTVRAEAQHAIEETAAIREYAEIDPVGFAMQALGDSVEGKSHLALSLLTDPAVFEALKGVLPQLNTPEGMRLITAEQKAARAEYRESAQVSIAEGAAVRQNLEEIKAACAAVLPSTMTPDQQRVAYADLLRDVQRAAGNRKTVPVEDLPLILRTRLTSIGVDPLVAAELMTKAVSAGSRTSRAAVRPAVAVARAAAPVAPRNGQSFVAGDQRRKAAAVPAGGAGAPGSAADLTLPTNPDGSKMSSEQAIQWHRSRVAKGQRVLGV